VGISMFISQVANDPNNVDRLSKLQMTAKLYFSLQLTFRFHSICRFEVLLLSKLDASADISRDRRAIVNV
jgi:hypothetical protein